MHGPRAVWHRLTAGHWPRPYRTSAGYTGCAICAVDAFQAFLSTQPTLFL